MKLEENERIDDLEYNGFKIIQNSKKFCFGSDSVILANFAKDIKKDSKVVDLGTGTGILGILLCAKTKLKSIIGIEIQKDMSEMAKKSINLNNLQEKFKILNIDLKEAINYLECNSIDAIITNPPYKKINTGLINESENKLISRHEVACTIEDIISVSNKLLRNNGKLYMIHRTERLVDVLYYCRKYKLEVKKLKFIKTNRNQEAKLFLIQAVKNGKIFLKIEKDLIMYDDNGNYTDEFLELYKKKEEKK